MLRSDQTELHCHLDGALRPDTLSELAKKLGLKVPHDLGFFPGMGLDEALARFAFTVSLLQTPAHLSRVAQEMCEDAIAQGTSHLEIRFGPQLHTGMTIERAIDAVLEGISGRAGLILCGLYGDAPELLMTLVEAARTRPNIVGLDLAGGPASHHSFGLKDYAPAFRKARDLGLGRTVHAGEGRPAEEIGHAITVLHAQRIGHGVSLLDSPYVTELVIKEGVTIEACPTSNIHTGVINSIEEHPIAKWLELGIKVAVCTDNTLLSSTDLPRELERVRVAHGLNPDQMNSLSQNAWNARFTFPRGSN